jgi:hypothetical protein
MRKADVAISCEIYVDKQMKAIFPYFISILVYSTAVVENYRIFQSKKQIIIFPKIMITQNTQRNKLRDGILNVKSNINIIIDIMWVWQLVTDFS